MGTSELALARWWMGTTEAWMGVELLLYPALCPHRSNHYCSHVQMKKSTLTRPQVTHGGAYRLTAYQEMGLEPFCVWLSAAALRNTKHRVPLCHPSAM